MNRTDTIYTNLLSNIKTWGANIPSRNAITRRCNFMSATLISTPLISIRKTAWKSALREMEWFLSGSTNINDLHKSVRKWWAPWADEDGDIPLIYGKQFRDFEGQSSTLDQVETIINRLKHDPYSRRLVMTMWNSTEMEMAALPCCHGTVIQLTVHPEHNTIDMFMHQRSADMILGVPHNWLQYWSLLLYLAHQSGRKVGHFTWSGGDCHIYPDHLHIVDDIVKKINEIKNTPQLIYNPTSDKFKASDFSLDRKYEPIIKEKLEMTV